MNMPLKCAKYTQTLCSKNTSGYTRHATTSISKWDIRGVGSGMHLYCRPSTHIHIFVSKSRGHRRTCQSPTRTVECMQLKQRVLSALELLNPFTHLRTAASKAYEPDKTWSSYQQPPRAQHPSMVRASWSTAPCCLRRSLERRESRIISIYDPVNGACGA